MKKLALLGVLIVMSSGCGRGWLPMFRGAPCNGNNCLPAPMAANCNGCSPATMGYGGYENEFSGGTYYGDEGGYYDGGIINGGRMIEGTINSPSMSPLPPPAS